MIWRVVTHEQTRGQSYTEVCAWNIDELDDCNAVLDAYDVAVAAIRAESEKANR
jgi:hypothetical protein